MSKEELTPYKYFKNGNNQDELKYQLGMNCYEISFSDKTINIMLNYSC